MSIVGTNALTLQDWASRKDPNGKVAAIVEILTQTNQILDDMIFVEGNLPTGHLTTVRSGLPAPTWRLLNYGVQPSKSKTTQVTDTVGMLEDYGVVDKDLAMMNGNTDEFRLSEDKAHIEGMNQEAASTIFYGNISTDPEKFMGLAPRYSSLSAENAENIITGDGTGSDNTSIWLVYWGEQTCHGIFPKGSKAGLTADNLGEDTVIDASGNRYQALTSHYQWKLGLTLRDWRYVVRICNIDVSNLTKNAATGSDLIDLMVQASEIVPYTKMGKPVFYCNKTVSSFLRRQVTNRTNMNLYLDSYEGKKILTLDGIPIKRCDALLNAEAIVS